MAMPHRTEGELIAYFEGQIPHLATKADVARIGGKLDVLLVEMRALKWLVCIAIPAAIAITGIVVGIVVQVLNNLPAQLKSRACLENVTTLENTQPMLLLSYVFHEVITQECVTASQVAKIFLEALSNSVSPFNYIYSSDSIGIVSQMLQ